jgi:polar amino acid transport system permease protein
MDGFQIDIIFLNNKELLIGACVTLKITAVSFVLALIIGTLVGIGRSRSGLLKIIFTPYVEIFRGTPLLIQLFFIYYGLPSLGINLSNFTAAYLGIGLCGGAYISEIIRGSLYSVDKGQYEAAKASGLSSYQTMRFIIFPQALNVAIPPLMNSFSSQLKETSLVSVLAINELTRSGQMVYSRTFRPFEIYLAVGVMYFIMTFIVSMFSRYLENVIHKSERISSNKSSF